MGDVEQAAGPRASRRGALRAGLAGLAAGVGALAGTRPAAAAGRRSTVRLTVDDLVAEVVGRRPGELPDVGDSVLLRGTLHNSAGSPTGHYYAVGLVVALPDRFTSPVVSRVEQHTFQLPGATLLGSGSSRADGTGDFAVVGGTGRCAGARGSYRATQSPAGQGGDGTATFVLTLLPVEA